MEYSHLVDYAHHCGAALARAHAKAGDAAVISGYIGRGEALDLALADFAAKYADQTEHDFAQLKAAAKSGRIPVEYA
jgi:thiamine monophosphate kinase